MMGLVFWVLLVMVGQDLRLHRSESTESILLSLVVLLITGAISRFTIRWLALPLARLQAGMAMVGSGRLEPVEVSRTGDEIEYLGESFNQMIGALAASKRQVQQYQNELEGRIRVRTEELEFAMHRALAANLAKSEFLANVSHELRTPMSGVIGMTDLVLESRLNEEQRDHLQTAQRCAYDLLALLNDILDLSKIEAGRMVLDKIAFDVRALADDCVKVQLPVAAGKGVEISCEASACIPPCIVGDPLRIRQVLTNLLANAVKFTERGYVRCRLSAADVSDRMIELSIEVEDTGPGIAQEMIEAIFDKFTQADGSTSRKYGGTGLGLAITRRLVELHGGSIRVKSEPGKGSRFTATVLCEPATEVNTPVTLRALGAGKKPNPGSNQRILVAEDNVVNQKVITAILRKRYEVDLANNGREAIAMLTAPDAPVYSLILMDVQMPELDGLETTRFLRQDERWSGLPILALTAHAMTGDRERCVEAGMDGYITKPVNPAHLLLTVERCLTGTPVA